VTGRWMCTFSLLLSAGIALCATSATAGVEDLEIGGRFLQDWVAWGETDEALGIATDDGTEVRSAYVSAKGRLGAHLRFKADYDVAGGEVGVKDVYLEVFGIPAVGNVRVGHWVVPVGLDQITSTKNLAFLEGGSPVALTPGRNSGLMVWNSFAGGRMTAELGAFREVDDVGEGIGSGEGGSIAGRMTGLLVKADDGSRLVHVAVSGVWSDPWGDVQRFRARPELHLSDYIVDTGLLPTESATTVGVELVGILGPAHFQGEYLMASLEALEADSAATRAEDASFAGFCVQAGYYLTGESRAFKGTSFDRTKVTSEFLDEGGFGAWEVLARYSSLDLNDEDAGVLGGKLDDVTLGLNWYMTSYARLMVNYVMATVDDADGDEIGKTNVLGARVQFDF